MKCLFESRKCSHMWKGCKLREFHLAMVLVDYFSTSSRDSYGRKSELSAMTQYIERQIHIGTIVEVSAYIPIIGDISAATLPQAIAMLLPVPL